MRWSLMALVGIVSFLLPLACNVPYKPTTIETPIMPGASFIGSDSCEACHDAIATQFSRTKHGRFISEGEAEKERVCEMCHGPGSLHMEKAGEEAPDVKKYIIRSQAETCYQCHLDTRATFYLPYHHPVPEGKMECTSCHAIHETGVQSTHFMEPGDQCFQCHQEKMGPFVWEHQALREGCEACHNPHGSVEDQLLSENDRNLCLKCHFQGNFPNLGTLNHQTLLAGTARCIDCHAQIHGSNFSRYFLGP
ncbi:MAG: cytochrome c3 family protein [Pseudomonadota bacterium]